MEENVHKDNLEEFFKNAVENSGDLPSDDGWDVPSDDVWEGVNAAINPPSNLSSPFPWRILSILLLGILLVGALYYNYSINQKLDKLTEIVEENKSEIENIKTDEDTNQSELTIGQMDSDRENQNTKSNPTEPQNIENKESSVFEDQPDVNSIENNKESAKSDKSNNKLSIINNNEAENNTIKKRNNQNESVQNPSANALNEDLESLKNNQPVNSKEEPTPSESQPSEKQPANKKKAIADNYPVNVDDSGIVPDEPINTFQHQNDVTVSKVDSIENADSLEPAEMIVDNINSKLDTAIINQNQVSVENPADEKDEIATVDDPSLEPEDSSAIVETLPPAGEKSPEASIKSTKGFYLGVHLAPTYAYRDIRTSGNNPVLRRLLNKQEKADYSYSFGIKAGYDFNKNWSVETGLNYSKATIQSRHMKQIRYRHEFEMENDQGDFDSDYNVALNTSYGDVETDIAVTRSSVTDIQQNDFINLRILTKQDLSFVRVPLVVKYTTAGAGKLHFSAKTGLVSTFTVNRDVTIRAVQLERPGVVLRRTTIQRKFTGLKKTSLDMLFGIGLEYDISDKFGVYFEPTISRSISPVYKTEAVKTFPVMTTFDVGLSYKF